MKKTMLLFLMGMFYVLGTIAYSYYSYITQEESFNLSTDRQLGWSASGGALLLGNYHHHEMDKVTVTQKDYIQVAKLLTSFNNKMNTDYIYAFIKKDNKIYYTTTSYKEDEWNHAYKKDFLTEYTAATELLKSTFTSMETSYEVSSDKYGTFKSILVPLTAIDGSTYVVGADLDITYIQERLHENLIRGVLLSLYFLILLIPIMLLYLGIVKEDRIILEQKIVERTTELNAANTFLNNLSSQLSKYLSPQIKDMIFAGKGHIGIKSSRKKLTVYFSDIKDFTKTTAHMEPEELTKILNSYFDAMNEIAIKHGGTIDKYIGDAILIFTGDPQSHGEKQDAIACVSMAIDMRNKIIELQKKWVRNGHQEGFHVRAGINTGYVTVGNFGSHQRMEYTIIGSQVNIAARLEGLANPDEIIISHETYSLVKDVVECVEFQEVQVKGIDWPIKTYKVLDYLDMKDSKIYDIDQDGVLVYVNMKKISPKYKDELESKVQGINAIIQKSEEEKKD